VAYLAVSKTDFSASGEAGVLFPVLAGVSIVLLGVQVVIRKYMDDDKLFARVLKMLPGDRPEETAARDSFRQALLQNHLSFGIILWALGESPAIYGLVLTFLSGNPGYTAGFASYSILNMFFYRPRRQVFEDQLTRLRRYVETKGTEPEFWQ
jgi:hypothetical protein